MKKELLSPLRLSKLPVGMHPDGGGLYLLVRESGSRSWVLRTIVRRHRRDIGLGGFPATSLAEAREEAKKLRSRARKGEDVLEARRIEKRVIPTFEQAAKTYHKQLSETFGSETHAYNWLQSLELHVFPAFGKRTVDTVDAADVLKAIGPIWTTTPDTARRTLRRVKAVFDYCQTAGFRNIMVGNLAIPLPNPCAGIAATLPNNRVSEKNHAALSWPDLPGFIEKLRASEASLPVKLGFEFLILTAARTSEVLNAKWAEIDIENATWNVPAERMKVGKAHVVPLPPRCLEILTAAKELNGGTIVFPSKLDYPLSNMCFLMTLRRLDGCKELTTHGFRATFKTWASERTAHDSLVIEAALAHQVKGIERHYLRTTFLDKRRELMGAWARFATAAPGEKVIPITRGR